MIKIGNYEFSDKLELLYNDVQNLKPECKIIIEIVENMQEENVDGMQETLINGDIRIVAKNRSYIESILSHELLHAYFLRLGYPNHHYVYGEDNPIFYFGQSLHNHVTHKLILEEQINRGFDVSAHQIHLAKNLGIGEEKENKDPYRITQNAMTILLCEVLCGEHKNLYEERINKSFPKAHTIAKQLYNAMMKENYTTPAETRRAIVRIYKRFNTILKNYKLPNLNLCENVTITYIPTSEDINKKVLKVFHICKQPKVIDGMTFWLLIANSDEQSSYIIATKNRTYNEIRELLKSITVKDLYKDSNCVMQIN